MLSYATATLWFWDNLRLARPRCLRRAPQLSITFLAHLPFGRSFFQRNSGMETAEQLASYWLRRSCMCRRLWMRPASCKLLGAQIVENDMSSCYQPLSFDSGWKMISRTSCEPAIARAICNKRFQQNLNLETHWRGFYLF